MVQLEEKLEEWWARLASEYEKRTPRSRELFERARRVLPGGTTYHIRFFKPYPVFIEHGLGPRVWDVDGNEYTDYWMGHGALILGHCPDLLEEAVRKALKASSHLGYENPYALEYAELLVQVLPGVEQVRFTNSGTEANMYAVRLARAYTGRKYIIKLEGAWHGGYDALHVGVTPPYEGPESLGLPEESIKYTLVAPFNDAGAVERLVKRYEVAAIWVEPVLGAGGGIEPEPGYLRELRRIADEAGALLVFDEVITGFRLALGGAQEYYNVKADIVVLGKIVGGGMPGAGAIASRAEVMELLDQLKRPKGRERSFHGGTFTGNPVTILTGYHTVKHLADNRGVYAEFNSLWDSVRRRIQEECESRDNICWATGTGSIVGIHFTRKRPRTAREALEERWSNKVYEVMHMYMRLNGILYMTEHMAHLLPSMAHSRRDADRFIEVFASFLDEIYRLVKKGALSTF
ncbi:aspartate aminotransferase family protein [Hyperthermus butylicus]|uniref:Glutamate-1-semialdehyde 2,1-aminomutase n=1 Tax=Hyperthermus butylicus (strain DSM 5456 / JCM 9403 / PLM1-5) TaxID=415426 RepID=A2BMP3_HYPBU|nr:aspartate aminotransferase family protein [Hyperthermus butylicus]ABM81254.1 glutamate-1-semialdehyde 2,1-aminomutase [Hyperthermus butylicus DSM 5456]